MQPETSQVLRVDARLVMGEITVVIVVVVEVADEVVDVKVTTMRKN